MGATVLARGVSMNALRQVRALVSEYLEVTGLSVIAFAAETGFWLSAVASILFGGWAFAVVTP